MALARKHSYCNRSRGFLFDFSGIYIYIYFINIIYIVDVSSSLLFLSLPPSPSGACLLPTYLCVFLEPVAHIFSVLVPVFLC